MGNISGFPDSTIFSTNINDRLADKAMVHRAPDPNERLGVTIGLTSLDADAMEQFWPSEG